jgi:hypothetical protein
MAPKDDEPQITLAVPGTPGHTITGAEHAVRRYVGERERQLVARTEWPTDNLQQMTALAKLFPSMTQSGGTPVPGTDPWDAEALVAWLNSGTSGSGGRHAGLFLLSVWNADDWTVHGLKVRKLGKDDWKGARRIGRFDFNDAWASWDEKHRAAALAWLINPFWP